MPYTFLGLPNVKTFRRRTTGSLEVVPGYDYKEWGKPVQSVTNVNYDDGFRTGYERTTHDIVVPQFRTRTLKGEIFNNPYFSVLFERRDSSIPTWQWQWTGGNVSVTSQTLGQGGSARTRCPDPNLTQVPEPTIDVDSLCNFAGTQAWAGVQQPEFDAPVFLAEAKETYMMLTRPWEGLVKFVNSVAANYRKTGRLKVINRRGSKSLRRVDGWSEGTYTRNNGLAIAKFLSENWFALRYGVKPFLSDIDDALSILKEEPTWNQRKTSRGKADSRQIVNIVEHGPISDSFFAANTRTTVKRRVSVRAGVMYTTRVITTSTRTGWQLSSLPRAGWEAIPFSFVADWIVNVGSVLAALESKADCDVLAQWTTITDSFERKCEVYGSTPKTVSNVSVSGSLDSHKHLLWTSKTREPRARVGFARTPVILDLSQEKWRNRALDVAAFASGFVSYSKGAARVQRSQVSRAQRAENWL